MTIKISVFYCIGLVSLFHCVFCEQTLFEHLQTYEKTVNVSLQLDKLDQLLINSWKADIQMKQVNITAEYRMQIERHGEHSFSWLRRNGKWKGCLKIHKRDIKKTKKVYYGSESECLKVANLADMNKKQAVEQVVKEIRSWRKSYRYLKNLCNNENPDDVDEAGSCLVNYIQKDNYYEILIRLVAIKLELMGQLFVEMTTSVTNLEECLQTQFSDYLQNVRSVMDVLNKCYNYKSQN